MTRPRLTLAGLRRAVAWATAAAVALMLGALAARHDMLATLARTAEDALR